MKFEDFSKCVCSNCDGTGTSTHHALLGAKLREKRETSKISLREMAGHLKVSAPYLSDLELGRRHWNKPIFERYLKELMK